jgi:ABC-type transport system substrate-binding protein
VTTIVEDIGTQFALYQDNEIDTSNVPSAELQAVLADPAYEGQLFQTSDLAVFFFAFAYDKEPTDNVHVRRALSASVDRNAFVQEIRQGRGVPMIHLTPPGMFGAPPINEVGVGYNPEYAREQLAEAGYANCEGLPNLDVLTYQGAGAWAEFLAASFERELGCSPDVFNLEQQEFSVLLETVDPANPPEDRPHLWTLGWGPDYPDAHNWVFDAGYIACASENSTHRPCTEIDDLIDEAARESDPDRRKELYFQVEEMAFGPEGDHPLITLYMRVDYTLVKPWYTGPFETDGLFGGPHWDWRTVDAEGQAAGRG